MSLCRYVDAILEQGHLDSWQEACVLKEYIYQAKLEVFCCFCSKPLNESNLTLEHVIPKSHCHNNDLDNITLSCYTCNQQRGTVDFYEFRKYKQSKVSNSYYALPPPVKSIRYIRDNKFRKLNLANNAVAKNFTSGITDIGELSKIHEIGKKYVKRILRRNGLIE